MAPITTYRPVVVSGPSGTGKSTLLTRLFCTYPSRFAFSVSHTTRAPRPGEQDGREYYFVTREQFEDLKARDGFIETAVFGGNYYGTSKKAVEEVMSGLGGKAVGEAKGEAVGHETDKKEEKGRRICVLDIEMEGVKQVLASSLNARVCFIAPPSINVLETRLRGRGTESDDAIRQRLRHAEAETEFARAAGEKIVVNDDLDRAYQELEEWVVDSGQWGEVKGKGE